MITITYLEARGLSRMNCTNGFDGEFNRTDNDVIK